MAAGTLEMIHHSPHFGRPPRPIVDERDSHKQSRSVWGRLDTLYAQALKYGIAALCQDFVKRMAHLPAKLPRFAVAWASRRLGMATVVSPRP